MPWPILECVAFRATDMDKVDMRNISQRSAHASPLRSPIMKYDETASCFAYCFVVLVRAQPRGMYTPTYPVWFWPNGTFNWRAPYLNGTAVEVGHGELMTSAVETRHRNGSWEAVWYEQLPIHIHTRY